MASEAEQTVRIHALMNGSRTNGPGRRNVVWFQGCGIGCPGCFNPASHDPQSGTEMLLEAVVNALLEGEPDGVTVSGGEPFEQPGALFGLLRRLRERRPKLSLLAFSGMTRERIAALTDGAKILALLDVLVSGPYVRDRHLGRGLLGSTNQRIHLLSDHHVAREFRELPQMEVVLHRDGSMSLSGIGDFSDKPVRDQREDNGKPLLY